MSWLEVDWRQERPPDAAVGRLWRSVDIRPLAGMPPVIGEYLSELRRVNVNGGAVYAQFEVDGNRDFDWFATRNRWDEIAFFSRFLASKAVSDTLPELTRGVSIDEAAVFEWRSSLTLDGELARALVIGGAYKKFERAPRAAKDLAAQVCDSIFGDRFLDVEVFWSGKPWSAWFQDVAWDSTHLIIDRRVQVVSILASTDTD